MITCCLNILSSIYIYIYIYNVKLAIIVEGDPKAPFSVATTPKCRVGRYSFHWIAPLTPNTLLTMLSVKQEASSTIFWVFGMSQPGIDPRSLGSWKTTFMYLHLIIMKLIISYKLFLDFNVYELYIIQGFQTIVFIFIVIFTTFRSICSPVFFRCLSNLGGYVELLTTSYI